MFNLTRIYHPSRTVSYSMGRRAAVQCWSSHDFLFCSNTKSNSYCVKSNSRNNNNYYCFNHRNKKRSLSTTTSINTESTTSSTDTKETRTSLLSTLHKMIPHVELVTNPYELDRHGRGESYHPIRRPDAVICPTNVDDIVTIVNFCVRHRIPIVPFGVGTSVEGHTCCLEGGISLDMSLFQNIEIPDMTSTESTGLPDPIAKVGAGVTRNTLNDALRHTGMQFVVDPGADATIGGMVATGASGTTAVRYGTMRDNILEVECVIPTPNNGDGDHLQYGTVVQTGTRALKDSAGYDLRSLMCGSEGTLGIITSITVKLHPIPEYVVAAICAFDTLKEAAEAVATLKLCDTPLVRCELLDKSSIVAFNNYEKDTPDMEVKPTLFLEFHGSSKEAVDEQVKLTESICTNDDFGGSNFKCTSNEEERKALWSARHKLYYASLNLRPGATGAILTDACVPLSKFADLIEATANDVDNLNVVGPCFGHAGDGNFHCILPVLDNDSDEYIQKLHQVNDNLIRRTLEVGGTCTGEHGVGYGKMKYLERQYGPGNVQVMKAIKTTLDPYNIMNPGKIVSL